MKSVKFVRRSPPYQVGEIAGFTPRIADRLIEYGYAEAYHPPKEDTSSQASRQRATLEADADKQMSTSGRKKQSYETKGT